MVTPAIGIFLPTMSERNAAPGDVAAAARHAEALVAEAGNLVGTTAQAR